jgi:hypothetical protein
MGEWENRELCPDGGCVGLIGKSGTCSVCGRKGSGTVVAAAEPETGEREGESDAEPDAEAPAPAPKAESALGGGEWDQRKLCPDGACVGVIGAKGRCSVCGRAGT